MELLRPFTLLAPLIVSSCVMIASLVFSGITELSELNVFLIVFPASMCFALLNGASNALNQATDYKEDAISKPYRPIPKGIFTVKEAFHISFIFYSIAIVLSLFIHFTFSLFIFCIALFSITYSLPPRMKKHLLINQIWVALSRGLLGILASWSVFGNPFQPLPIAIGSIAALFLFGGTATKDILDTNADRIAGTKTLVNVYGLQKAAKISLFFMGGSFGLILPLIAFHIIDISFLPLSCLIVLSVIIYWLMIHNRKNETYENTSSWTLMYATYFLFALGFAFITIFSA